ncbi:hypothetical protein [Streptomyces sp. MAR4 CNX-425]|uniref:hypothetical protein n=1 Tax=Streptomyces sp. MAR4 CNX-425 TaxID=3406343 RepID=UPI003B503557
MTKVKVRKSVPLTSEDQAVLDRLRTPGTAEHEALRDVAGILLDDDASEAETLHALLTAGRLAVTERVMLSGYAALAAAQDEDAADRRAMRARAARLKG